MNRMANQEATLSLVEKVVNRLRDELNEEDAI